MKGKIVELDVDFIGGEGPLTKEEEKQIGEFIKSQKLLRVKKQTQKPGVPNKNKTAV
jgi:hypothetical protein